MMTKTTSFTAGSHVFGLKRLNTAKGIVETEKEKKKKRMKKKRSPAAILFLSYWSYTRVSNVENEFNVLF